MRMRYDDLDLNRKERYMLSVLLLIDECKHFGAEDRTLYIRLHATRGAFSSV